MKCDETAALLPGKLGLTDASVGEAINSDRARFPRGVG
jgi:hypothetical protein